MKTLLKKYLPFAWRKSIERMLKGIQMDEVEYAYYLLKNNECRVMLDVGAHHGHSLEPFARDGWEVLAFEPDPNNRAILQKSWGRRKNVEILPFAVGEEDREEVSFFTSQVSTGISSVLSFHESHQEAYKVRMVALKTVLAERGTKEVGFLKTDVEGYDLFALKGMDWKFFSPDCVVSEFDDFKTTKLGYDLSDMVSFMKDKGYEVLISEWYPIEEYGKSHRWRRFVTDPKLVTEERTWGNIICVKPILWERLQKLLVSRGFQIETN
ncbi:MAG: hypothetical protein CMN32_03710 [Saprospirales bacterium]|nr:hypothetical protein [Saprospirales bacterium]